MEQTYPLGTRLADADGTHYVVVGHHDDGTTLLLEEAAVDHGEPCHESLVSEEWAVDHWGPLTEAPDTDRSTTVLAYYQAEQQAARASRDAMTGEQQVTTFAAQPFRASVAETHAEYRQADAALRAAQDAVAAAARLRAEKIREMVRLTGSQTAAARVLEIHQSNVSRALALLG